MMGGGVGFVDLRIPILPFTDGLWTLSDSETIFHSQEKGGLSHMVLHWFQKGEIDSQIHSTADAEQLCCGADKAKSEGEACCYSSTVSGARCGHLTDAPGRCFGHVHPKEDPQGRPRKSWGAYIYLLARECQQTEMVEVAGEQNVWASLLRGSSVRIQDVLFLFALLDFLRKPTCVFLTQNLLTDNHSHMV